MLREKTSRSTAPKRKRNPGNVVTEIQAEGSKKQQTQNAISEIHYTQVRTKPNVLDKKVNIYYAPKQNYQTRPLQLRLLKFRPEAIASLNLLNSSAFHR